MQASRGTALRKSGIVVRFPIERDGPGAAASADPIHQQPRPEGQKEHEDHIHQ